MKRWSILTAVLYAAALVLLTIPFLRTAFPNAAQPEQAYSWPGYWVWVGFMTLCAGLLLVAPVRLASRRDLSRRPLALAVGVTAFLFTMLVLGATASIGELLAGLHVFDWLNLSGFVTITMGLWAFWAAVLYWLTRRQAPLSAVREWARALLAGSVLELLVAVPSHVIVRGRTDCCAGFYTLIGLATGISVMFLSFGPGVFFLFRERRFRIRQPANAPR